MLSWITNFLCPPTKSVVYQQAESCFTKEELDAIRKEHCVHVLSQYIQTVDDKHFLEWAGLQHAALALRQGLCNAVRRQSGDGAVTITLDGIIVAKAMCEKMDRLTAEDFAYEVLDLDGTRAVTKEHLQAVVAGCLELAFHYSSSESGGGCMDHSATAAAIAAGACGVDRGEHLTRDAYSKLCKTAPALNTALTSLLLNIGKPAGGAGSAAEHAAATPALMPPRPASSPSTAAATAGSAASSGSRLAGNSNSSSSSRARLTPATSHQGLGKAAGLAAAATAAATAPTCPGLLLLPQLGWGLCSPHEGLLQPAWVWLLSAGLPPALRQEWRLLFNSVKHGLSFSTFLGRLGDACPTLLLVRDKGGAVFGGIAHSPWKKAGAFFGDYASCIFSLLPAAQLYPASGINGNLQWCGSGFKELPNGVGFGGQVGHFAMWLDATLDTGMSRPSATYASPCLASSQTFQVDAVEAWLLTPPEEELPATGSGAGKQTVLQKATEDQKILEWAGVGKNYSAALKDEPIED